MPNIYVPEGVFKMYVEKYGYTEAKAKIPEILEQFIKVGKESISKANLR